MRTIDKQLKIDKKEVFTYEEVVKICNSLPLVAEENLDSEKEIREHFDRVIELAILRVGN